MAHELNEPLGSILDFAQLMQKGPGIPEPAAHDLDRIVAASLHAREVIHELLVFSRQKTPVKAPRDLNRIMQEGLYFLESRCARAGIAIVSELDPGLPEIKVDASQLHQVLVNLGVSSRTLHRSAFTSIVNRPGSSRSAFARISSTFFLSVLPSAFSPQRRST